MKQKKYFSFYLLILFQFLSFNIHIINSFGIKDADKHLLIYFFQEKTKTLNDLSEENYMKELMYREIYSMYNIGIPNQNLKIYYDMNNYESYIYEDYYYKTRSTTYKLIDEKYKNISNNNNKFEINDPNGYLSQEILELSKNYKIENFTFLLKPKTNNKEIKSVNAFGLSYKKDDKNNLLYKLKEKKYIHSRVFSFLFGDDSLTESKVYDGQILFGCFPHDISIYFDETELYYTSLKDSGNKNWHIQFDTVKYNEDELKDKIAELDINLNIIIGPEKFRKKLLNTLFRDFVDNKKCKEGVFKSDKDGEKYLFYSFDNDIQFKEIPNLSFESKDLNETFNISFSKLFIRYKERYYFNVVFKKKPDNKWVFGQIFFNMYRFVFDLEEGQIGYYKSYSSSNHPLIVLLCFFVFAIIFILGYWRGKVVKSNEANIVKQAAIPVRKEYANVPTNDSEENKNKKENKKDNIKEDNKDEKSKLKDKKEKEKENVNNKKVKNE